MRPAALAGDSSGDADFMRHALDWFKANEPSAPEYLANLRPTTPLRDPRHLEEAVALLLSRPEATSLRSAHAAPESPFKWFLRADGGYFSGIDPKYSNEDINKPRQSFPEVYVPDGYIDLISSESFSASGLLHGPRMLAFVSPRCHEVDVPEDFDYLEFEIKKNGSPLLDWLKAEFPL
jgi:N-acylneuraminate cytidylyltransferase